METAFEIINKKANPLTENRPNASREEIVGAIYRSWKNGQTKILCNDYRRVVHLVVYKNPYVGDVHVYADTDGTWDIVKAHKQFLEWFEENSGLHKLHAGTIHPALAMMCERTGWTFEGIRYLSSFDENGEFVDKYLYGRIRGG